MKERDLQELKAFLFSSSVKAFVVAGGFLVLSLLLNLGIVAVFPGEEVYGALVKGAAIVGFFFFMCVSVLNLRELRGKVGGWQDLTLLVVLSILQGVLSGWTVLFSLLGILAVVAYFWLMQAKLEAEA
ncbi:MAG: hypothetical protein Kow0069_29800 [Promethearchaeota archaeon]